MDIVGYQWVRKRGRHGHPDHTSCDYQIVEIWSRIWQVVKNKTRQKEAHKQRNLPSKYLVNIADKKSGYHAKRQRIYGQITCYLSYFLTGYIKHTFRL